LGLFDLFHLLADLGYPGLVANTTTCRSIACSNAALTD